MNEELNKAMEQISDKHITEAVALQKKRRPYWIGAVAATLAVAILAGIFYTRGNHPTDVPRPTIQGAPHADIPTPGDIQSPASLQLKSLAAGPVYPQMVPCPDYADYSDYKTYSNDLVKWERDQWKQYDQPDGYADSLDSFFKDSIQEFLTGDQNRAYSPLNVYLALAMLAETANGNSRQQLLDLLGADSIEELRTQAGHVWNAHYCNDGQTTSLLANSLWLDEQYTFKDDGVQTLADSYFASVFHGDLGSEPVDEDLRTWINTQTGGLLKEQAQNLKLDKNAVFALASTAYFRAGWDSEFSTSKTAEGIFHCEDADLTTEFMNKDITFGTYYRGTDFGAVRLALTGDNAMWLILPDEGKTVEDVLAGDEYWEMTQNPGSWQNKKVLTIHLSLPKFDISSQADLISGMKNLGIADVFNPNVSDFSTLTDAKDLAVGKIDHAARVAIDEEGVIAAAYTVIVNYAGAAPGFPEEEIDFVLDRPFLFMVTSRDHLPLFAGVVEQP